MERVVDKQLVDSATLLTTLVLHCIYTKGHCTLRHFCVCFSIFSSFPIKMHAKTQKIEPDPMFFMTDESFGGSV